jgi:hypothetical protein
MNKDIKESQKMSRMSRDQFERYDQKLRNKEQASQQRQSTRAADQWLAEVNKGGAPTPKELPQPPPPPQMPSFEEWKAGKMDPIYRNDPEGLLRDRYLDYKDFYYPQELAKHNELIKKRFYIPSKSGEESGGVKQNWITLGAA